MRTTHFLLSLPLALLACTPVHAGDALQPCANEPGPLPETCRIAVGNPGFDDGTLAPWLAAGPHSLPAVVRNNGNAELQIRHPGGGVMQFVPLPTHAPQTAPATEYIASLRARTDQGMATVRVSAAVMGQDWQPVPLFTRSYAVSTVPVDISGAFFGAPMLLPPQLILSVTRVDQNADASVFIDDVHMKQRR